ncbi:hypothetical protein QTO31_15050 [Chloroflexus sp. MS-CIW-1]|uniref:hypothetical protein n=1 Tax=Chloroflexus sp. MS-CIW-1 TaxID=3055768 RepID=UPI0026482BC2|nr:hypothetical protein [Chloroflexus sp. MS-CIW-1]MDN5273286.1 hypothetical protein [Chloroflexus sp. MS-CIW-1]
MHPWRVRLLLPGLLLVWLVLSHSIVATTTAQSSDMPDMTLVARPAFQGFVRPGTWLPVAVEVTNRGVDRSVEIVVGTSNGPFQSTFIDVPGGGRKGVTILAYIYGNSRQLNVRLLADGAEVATTSARLQLVSEGVLVGVIGDREVRLPAQLTDGIRVTSVPLSLMELPTESLGLSAFDALILTDVAVNEVSPAQQSALQGWVQRGGTLLVNGDIGIQRTLSLLPPELVAATVSARSDPLSDPPLTLVGLNPATGTATQRVFPVTIPLIKSQLPLAYGIRYGEGQAIVLAFDLATPQLINWIGWRELWQALLPPPSFIPQGLGFGTKLYATYLEENLASALTSLPALDLPSLNVIGMLLACYLIVVGPITYLVLRRLDRLALGWIVIPVLTVIFAAIAYSIGYGLRGGEVIISQITLLDANTPTLARERAFIGIFSPDRSTYRLGTTDTTALVRPISVQGPWSTPSLTNGRYVQAAADGQVVEGLEIQQWSLQGLLSDRIVRTPDLTAHITIDGDEVKGDVTNRSDRSLEDVVLIYGNRVGMIGNLSPGEQRSVSLEQPSHAFDGISLSYLIYGPQFEAMGKIGQPVSPTLQLRGRILDALYGYGTNTRGLQPLVLAWYSNTITWLTPLERRATMQQLTLIRGTAHLRTTGELELRNGSFSISVEQSGGFNSPCYTGDRLGIIPDSNATVMRFTLPESLVGLQPTSLAFSLRSDSFWNGDIEVYNWTNGQWESVPTQVFQNIEVEIPQPDHFLSHQGIIRLRLKNRDMQNLTCVYPDPIVRGRLP